MKIIKQLELLQSQAPAEGVLKGVECSRARSKEHGTRSKKQGAMEKFGKIFGKFWKIYLENFRKNIWKIEKIF